MDPLWSLILDFLRKQALTNVFSLSTKAFGKTKAFRKVPRRYFELKNKTDFFFLLPAKQGYLLTAWDMAAIYKI